MAKYWQICLILVCSLTAMQAVAQAKSDGSALGQTLEQAEQLLNQGLATQAYALLQQSELEFAGSMAFDYLLGMAALDTAQPSEAVFALQRVLRQDPGYAAARMELARAYYDLGEYEQAKLEFERLQHEQPPAKVAAVIEQYLLAISQRQSRYKTVTAGFVEIEGGWNSNANAATELNNFLGFQLDEASQDTASAYYGAAVGGRVNIPLAVRWQLQPAINVRHRQYPAAGQVDTDEVTASLALAYQLGKLTTQISANGGYLALAGQRNHYSATGDLGLRYQLSDQLQFSSNLRAGSKRYAEALAVKDVDLLYLSVGGERQFLDKGQSRLGLTLFAGYETGLNENSEGQETATRVITGLQGLFGRQLTATSRFYFLLAGFRSQYEDPYFVAASGGPLDRVDLQYRAALSVISTQLPVLKNWSLRPQLQYVYNQSDIELFEYRSFEAGISLRKHF